MSGNLKKPPALHSCFPRNTWCGFNPDHTSISDDEEHFLLPSGDPTPRDINSRTSRMLDGPIYGSIRERDNSRGIASGSNESGDTESSAFGRDPSRSAWTRNVKDFVKLARLIKPDGLRRLQIRAISVIIGLLASTCISFLVPILTARVVNELYSNDTNAPWVGIMILSALCFSGTAITLFCEYLWIPFKCFITETLSRKAYSHFLHLSSDFHNVENIAEKTTSIQGANVMSEVLEFSFLRFCPWLVQLCSATIYLSIVMVPYQGFILAGSMFIHLFLTSKLAHEVSWENEALSKPFQKEQLIRYNGFRGSKTIQALNQNGYEDNLHSNAVSTRMCQVKTYAQRRGQVAGFQRILLALGLTVSLCHAISQATVGAATVGHLAMLIVFWSQLHTPVRSLSRAVQNTSQGFSQAAAFFRLLHRTPAVYNRQNARPLKRIAGKVKFDGVSFAFREHQTVIDNASFEVAGGETAYIIGDKGSGKSTLLNLLNRSSNVTKGAILIDGQDIRDVDLFSLRDRVGILSDTCYIFDDTILNNVRYSRVTASDGEVFRACKAAILHDEILRFPQGYATVVGDNGIKLSVSEVQKIAIAREFLRDPDILVLDNATSALDPSTEQRIMASLTKRKRTTFIVHRDLAKSLDAHQILVIENGRLVEDGAPRKLMLDDGRYSALWLKENNSSRDNALCGTKFFSRDARSSLPELPIQVAGHRASLAGDDRPFMTAPSTPQHVKEGSRLNPIAPTFTPKAPTPSQAAARKRNETSTEDSVPGTVSKPASSQTSRQWSDELEEKADHGDDIVQSQTINDGTSNGGSGGWW
uniref:ABC transporter domain-containing protein n=1 Tax=Bionectria ochroleuca TaxID=29856 RepID=A0A8H7N6Y6_BIOOC